MNSSIRTICLSEVRPARTVLDGRITCDTETWFLVCPLRPGIRSRSRSGDSGVVKGTDWKSTQVSGCEENPHTGRTRELHPEGSRARSELGCRGRPQKTTAGLLEGHCMTTGEGRPVGPPQLFSGNKMELSSNTTG